MNNLVKNIYGETKFEFEEGFEFDKDFKYPLNWIKVFYKRYPRMDSVPLLKSTYSPVSLSESIDKRESVRTFEETKVSYQDISEIIHHSAGIKNPETHPDKMKRMYPSAGARFPLELYLIANSVENLDKGLYHYDVKGDALEKLLEEDLSRESQGIFGEGNFPVNPNFLVITSVFGRTQVKYGGANAYRFSCIEAGHLGQNISLITAEKSLGSCAIGGFDNNKLSKLLDLTEEEIPLYAFALGESRASL
jgi:SagB-type dehydrogenase family enzyme